MKRLVLSLSFVCAAALLAAAPALAADANPSASPSAVPGQLTYTVWGYKWDGRQYVRQTAYDFNTADVQKAADYAAQINRCAGWTATTNLPAQYSTYVHFPAISIGGRTIYLPSMTIRLPRGAQRNVQSGDTASTPSYDDSQAMQDSLNLQNMINTQDMISTQNMLNTQDMINNQIRNNNIQDMVNTQNMINTQNAIDAQNAANAQMNNP
jgi:hypothetical protein